MLITINKQIDDNELEQMICGSQERLVHGALPIPLLWGPSLLIFFFISHYRNLNSPWMEYLQHGNQKTLQIGAFSSREPIVQLLLALPLAVAIMNLSGLVQLLSATSQFFVRIFF